jgi:hypothetical protein
MYFKTPSEYKAIQAGLVIRLDGQAARPTNVDILLFSLRWKGYDEEKARKTVI